LSFGSTWEAIGKPGCSEVPPINSAKGNLVKSVFEKENGLEASANIQPITEILIGAVDRPERTPMACGAKDRNVAKTVSFAAVLDRAL